MNLPLSLTFFSQVITIAIGLGIILLALGYGVDQWKTGGRRHREEDTQSRENLIIQLQAELKAQRDINQSQESRFREREKQHVEQLKLLQSQINELTSKVGKLEGINFANNQKLKEQLDIIAYRNPEMTETLDDLKRTVELVVPFMDEMRGSHAVAREALDSILSALRAVERPPREKGGV